MKRIEIVGAVLIALVVIGTPITAFAYQSIASGQNCQTIAMRIHESGGPLPDVIRVKRGQPVCLRLTSYDVTHGFIISDLNVDAGAIHPGKWTVVNFVPPESGEFSFVCSIRCSPLHSRLRGKIIVED